MKRILLSLLLTGISLMGLAQAPTVTSFTPSYGSVGTLVTITGTNLTSPTVFTIGGVNAIVISNTGSSLVGMVMPGATTGTVSVSTAGGTGVSSSNFTVMATPGPNTQQGNKLVPAGFVSPTSEPYLGYAVAMSADGNTAVISGYNDNDKQGAVWIYTKSGSTWTQQGNKLVGTGNVTPAVQGISVAISANGNTVLVGGYEDNTGVGAAWVFVRNGTTWSQQGNKLLGTGNVLNSSQGCSVSLSADGNTAALGGYSDATNTGAVWIFTRNGGVWTQQGAKLVGTGGVGAGGQGNAVALSADGTTLAEAAPADDNRLGAIWIFTRTGNTWTQQGSKLVPAGNIGVSPFMGASIAINANGNTILVAGYEDNNSIGATWVFSRTGTTWTQQAKLVGTGYVGQSYQGYSSSLSADGNTAVITGAGDDNGTGAFWIFKRTGTTWTQQGSKKTGTGNVGAALQCQTISLSADGYTLIEGGYTDNTAIGAAWVFNYISDNADLSSLTISSGTLTPVFDAATTTYTASVSDATTSMTVTPVRSDPNATIAVQVNGGGFSAVTSGTASSSLALNLGSNTIQVRVTAQNASTKIYTITVTRLTDQTITFAALANRTYGDAPFNLSATGGASGNAVTYTSSNTSVATVSGNTVTIIAAGTTNIKASQAGNTSYNAATDVIQALVIDKKTIAVTAAAKSKTYGDADPAFTYTSTPTLVTGDNFTGTLNRAAGENVGAYAINQNTLALSTNYILNYTGANLTIAAKTISVTAAAKNKVYGDADPAFTYTSTPALAFSDGFTGTLSRAAGENVGLYAITQNTLALSSNYVLNYTTANLNIGTKTITVTADPKIKTYGDADPALTYTAAPALAFSDVFSGALNRNPGENAGSYAINRNTLSLGPNYVLNYTGAFLNIMAKTITVTADAKSKAYGDADPALTYTFTPALAFSDDFTGALNRTAGENVGTHAINQNTLALSANYLLNYTGANLTIGTKTITVTADAKSKTYGDADPAFTYTFTPALASGDNFTGALNRTAGEDAGTHAINQNTLALGSGYVLNYTGADLTIDKKTITVSANDISKTYGDADPVLPYTYGPALAFTDDFTGELSRTAGEDVGTYAMNQNTLALSNNYILNYSSADLTITTRTITVTADAKSKTYGDTDPALSYTFTPALIAGDNFSGALSRTAGENVGTHAINQNTLDLGSNYILNYTGADLSISKKTLTITADDKSRVFGVANPSFTASYNGFTGTDNASVLTTPVTLSTTADINSAAGNYAITATGASALNYDISFADGTLTIGVQTQSISFSPLAEKLSTDAIFTLTATATSGLTISYTSSDVSIARIVNGNQVEILKEGTVTITASQDGNGNYTAATPVSQQLMINDNPLPVVIIESDKGNSISKGETARLTASGADTYVWTSETGIVSGQNTSVLTVRPSITTTYTVTGTSIYGRSSTQTFTLEVKNDLKTADATNILTPDGDGINDYWIVKNIDLYPNNEVKIFDRTGRLVYSKKNYDNTWGATLNGSPLAEGTYYYIIDYGNDTGLKKGYITVIRRN